MGCIDKKISELSNLAAPAVNDLLVIVDVSIAGYETRNITVADFVTGGIVAPADAQYVTLALDADLTNERVLTGTANQVIVTDGGAGGPVTLSTPQDINVGSTPTFGGLTINGNITVTGTVDGVDVAGIASAQFVTMVASADLANERILTGTVNQVVVTDGGAGGNVTLSLPQDIHILATPQFDGMTLTGQLLIDGGADEIQLRVQADAAQSANIMTIEDSAGNVLAGADERGVLFSDAGIDVDSVYIGPDAGNIAHTNALYSIGIGTAALSSLTTGDYNLAIGYHSGMNINSGASNVFLGFGSGEALTIGSKNFGIGYETLQALVSGDENVAVGQACMRDMVGPVNYNTAVGSQALRYSTGNDNVAIGYRALIDANNVASNNVAIGSLAGLEVESAAALVAIGYSASHDLTTGSYNTTVGVQSGYFNQTGQRNVAVGYNALRGVAGNSNSFNVAVGYAAGEDITTSSDNTLVGYFAGGNIINGVDNTCYGYKAGDILTSGARNIIIGHDVDPTANNASDQLNIGDLIYGNVSATKRAGINVTPPSLAATFHIDQLSSTGAVPVLLLDQADIDIVLMKIIGTAEAASADRTLVAVGDYGTPGALVGWYQVEVQDDGNRIADGDYYVALYATPT